VFTIFFVGKGEEGLDLVFLDDTAVHLELFSDGLNLLFSHLGEFEGISCGDISSDVLSEE
jgi:hypothetical protein